MKILIIEDETLASERLEKMVALLAPEATIIAGIKSIEAGEAWFQENAQPDLILSDIKLLDGLSFELFSKVDTKSPVIFTTAYDQYAIKAFEVNSIDYLLKPVEKDKLAASIEKFKSAKKSEIDYTSVLQLLDEKKRTFKTRYLIKVGAKIVAIPVEKIAYFFSQNKLTFIVTHDGNKYPMDQSLELVDQQLDPKEFFRANRQYLIRFEAIETIHPYFKGRMKLELKPIAEHDIVVSSDKTPEFKMWLDQ
ncbi:MAG: response regulator transcription factor [Cyclobacteriaceae bacterium]|nr:response regulator transcription factor [Cyclobacteriaceae bacterium HetDA_MAG_MS6]